MVFNFKSDVGHRAPSIPSVFVVDTHATRPAVPPRLGKQKKQSGVAQTLLFVLVTLALFGVFFEAVLIYRLYQSEHAPSGFTSKQINGSPPPDTTDTDGRVRPSKPVAHLTDGQDVKHDTQVLAWSEIAEPLLYEMTYKDKHLIIQKEGYYYIYSKVYFSQGGNFYHSVMMETEMYAGKGIYLLEAREYSSKKDKEPMTFSNSFLAGVFYLSQNDAIYVKVSNSKQIIKHKSCENVFGAYMI